MPLVICDLYGKDWLFQDQVMYFPEQNAKEYQLEIAFKNKQLRDLCSDQELCIDKWSKDFAMELMTTLADIRASESIYDIPTRQPDIMDTKSGSKCLVRFSKGFTMLFTANHVDNPINDQHKVEWKEVYRIKITDINESK